MPLYVPWWPRKVYDKGCFFGVDCVGRESLSMPIGIKRPGNKQTQMNQIIHSADKKRAAVLYSNDSNSPIEARIYVNCNPAYPTHSGLGDATLLHKRASAARLNGLMLWVGKQLQSA